jgi:hypothetical protein
MTINDPMDILVRFRMRSEENFVFACQASVPLLFTPDLLYQLWNNFKQYSFNYEPAVFHRISHMAVSDLLLSPVCKKVGFELYEMDKGCRTILQEHLVVLLGKGRKYQLAAFLEDYAQLEYRYGRRKNVRDIHFLTALSILDPRKMERQLFEHLQGAQSASEKLNYLMLHRRLLPVGFVPLLTTDDRPAEQEHPEAGLEIADDPNQSEVLHITLPPALRQAMKNIDRQDTMRRKSNRARALELIDKCRETGALTLDLGNCGLSDTDWEPGGSLDTALRKCTHLLSLTLSNSTIAFFTGQRRRSTNQGVPNRLSAIPSAVNALKSLESLYCNGEPELSWGIQAVQLELPILKELDLSWNRISNPDPIGRLQTLEYLFLSFNTVIRVNWIEQLSRLELLELRNNGITDLRGLKRLFRQGRPEMDFANNPLQHPSQEIYQRGRMALLAYFTHEPLPASGDDTYVPVAVDEINADEQENDWPWLGVGVYSGDTWDKQSVRLLFSAAGLEDNRIGASGEISDESVLKKDSLSMIRSGVYDKATQRHILNSLIPARFAEQLKRKNIVWRLDPHTMGYPWEKVILPGGRTPLGLCACMVRQPVWGLQSPPAGADRKRQALLISASRFTADSLSAIDGLLGDNGFRTVHISGGNPDLKHIRKEIGSGKYRLVQVNAQNSQLILAELQRLDSVPEFIFINASNSARAEMVQQLLEKGARAVILVDGELDGPIGAQFDEAFYQRMFAGDGFGRAVLHARQIVHQKHPQSVNALAYRCYGDPFYDLRLAGTAALRRKTIVLSDIPEWKDFRDSLRSFLNRTINNWNNQRNNSYLELDIREGQNADRTIPEDCELFILVADGSPDAAQLVQLDAAVRALAERGGPGVLVFCKQQKDQVFAIDPYLTHLTAAQRKKVFLEYYTARKEMVTMLAQAVDRFLLYSGEPSPGQIGEKARRLADQYEYIRRSSPTGSRRTGELIQIAEEMKKTAEEMVPSLSSLVKSKSAGLKLAAISALHEYPDLKYVNWLAGCTGDEEKPFIGFRASLALLNAAEKFRRESGDNMYHAVQKAMANVLTSHYRDDNQVETLRQADEMIRKGPLLKSSGYKELTRFEGTWQGYYMEGDDRTEFSMELWLDRNNGFRAVTNEERDLGKADIIGEIDLREGRMEFIKRYRRSDINHFDVLYKGEFTDPWTVSGNWVLEGIGKDAFSMTKKE